MLNKWAHKILFGGVAFGFLLLPVLMLIPEPADGTSGSMFNLPAYNKYQCTICHTISAPAVGNAPLNVFGDDFLANGKVWNRDLAEKNSDGDKCSNGFELGDLDGDGVFDEGGTPTENGNPGDPSDCSIALTFKTWGVIKDIFSKELPK
jgi:hypothetical protein